VIRTDERSSSYRRHSADSKLRTVVLVCERTKLDPTHAHKVTEEKRTDDECCISDRAQRIRVKGREGGVSLNNDREKKKGAKGTNGGEDRRDSS